MGWGQGAVDKSACCQAPHPEFNPQGTQGRKEEPIPAGCPLAVAHTDTRNK